jgi:hypothetical protein
MTPDITMKNMNFLQVLSSYTYLSDSFFEPTKQSDSIKKLEKAATTPYTKYIWPTFGHREANRRLLFANKNVAD